MVDFTLANQQELDVLSKVGYKLSPATLAAKITQGGWVPAKHLLYLSTKIAAAIAKGNSRLIISVPPRHGKSELVSVNTPIWTLENWPNKKIILSSYGSDLSTDFSIRVRDTFTDPEMEAYLNTRLKKDARGASKFATTKDGVMYAIGIGGAITGRGGHVFILDDYIKNNIDAFSESQRETAWNWLISTAFTRREPGCSFIIIATRWHRDDIIGRILEEYPSLFEYIRLPAIAEEEDPLGREVDEALWPERIPYDELMEIKSIVGNYWWKSLYQQDPPASINAAELGQQIKIVREDEVPHVSQLKIVRAWDLAGTEGDGDWTSGPKLAYHKKTKKWYILDMKRKQYSSGRVEQLVRGTAEEDTPDVPVIIEQEPGSAGKGVIERYKHEILKGYNVTGDHPTGPIEARAMPFLGVIESGNVHMVAADWNAKLVDEIEAFPNGNHDDQISALSLAYKKIVKSQYGSVVWGSESSTEGGIWTPSHTGRKFKPTGVIW